MSPRALASEPLTQFVSPFLTASEAAAFLRFASVRALYEAIRRGTTNAAGERLPVLYRGRTVLFDREALTAWLHATTVAPRASAVKMQTLSRKAAFHRSER